ncbi:MAG: hypothetical protein ACK5YI_15450 [Rhodospirillales bacterium]|jgi:PAS domain-containing protein
MPSSHLSNDPMFSRNIDGLTALDGAQIVVSRDLTDLSLVDRLADTIDAIVFENAARRTRIQAGLTAAGRRRVETEYAEAMARHRSALDAIVDAMLDAGTELSVAVEICPIPDAFAAGPVRMGSIYVYPAVTPVSH